MKFFSKPAIVAICLMIGWVAASGFGFAASVCCTDIIDMCRTSHAAALNPSDCVDPCLPSHNSTGKRAHHGPPVIISEGHQDDVTCCESNPCGNAGLTLIVPPSQPVLPHLSALVITLKPATIDSHHFDIAAFKALLPSSTPLYIQKNVLIC